MHARTSTRLRRLVHADAMAATVDVEVCEQPLRSSVTSSGMPVHIARMPSVVSPSCAAVTHNGTETRERTCHIG